MKYSILALTIATFIASLMVPDDAYAGWERARDKRGVKGFICERYRFPSAEAMARYRANTGKFFHELDAELKSEHRNSPIFQVTKIVLKYRVIMNSDDCPLSAVLSADIIGHSAFFGTTNMRHGVVSADGRVLFDAPDDRTVQLFINLLRNRYADVEIVWAD